MAKNEAPRLDRPWREASPGGVVRDAGNSVLYVTGTWRSMRPVRDLEQCTQCLICWIVCPDAAITIEDGKVVTREMRDKIGHSHFTGQGHSEETTGIGHGMDASSHNKHLSMAEVISDCAALLCGGMGIGAYQSMRSLNIQPVVTDITDIDTAVQAYIDGKLVDHTELLH